MRHRITEQRLLEILKSKNIELLEPYKGSTCKIHKFKCHCGKVFEKQPRIITITSFKGCGCSRLNKRNNPLLPYDEVQKRLNKIGMSLIGEYKGREYEHTIKCHCGKIFTCTLNKLLYLDQASCGCSFEGKNNHMWTGLGEIRGQFFAGIRKGAKDRNIDFNITIEYIWELFLKQNKKCVLSSADLCFRSSYKKSDGTASLDRIDSSKGYIEGNVQWVHKDINRMKWTLSDEKFIKWCHLVSKNHPE